MMQKQKVKEFLKKAVAVELAAVMTMGLVACGKGSETASSEESSVQKDSTSVEEVSSESTEEVSLFNSGGQLPIVNEEITLKVLAVDDTTHPTGHVYTSDIWDWLTEKTGIKFELEMYTAEEMKQKLPLIMAGNDLPDIFMRCNLTAGDLQSYAENGKILAMDDLYEEYGYYSKELAAAYDYSMSFFKAADGHIYGLPQCASNGWIDGLRINTVWLENVGMEMPTTLEELYDVLVAFKEKDANGNGDPNDEIPMCFSGATAMAFKNTIMSWVGFSQFWPASGATFDADEDGKVFLTPITDEYRYLLEFLNKCYKEKLLDNEMFTHTRDEFTSKINANRAGVYAPVSDTVKEELGITDAALILSSAVNEEAFWSSGIPFNPNLFSISATTEYPEICFLLGDYLYSEECSWVMSFGVEGEGFEWIDKENYQVKNLAEGNSYYLFANFWKRPEWAQSGTDEVYRKDFQTRVEKSKPAFQNYLTFTTEENDVNAALMTDISSVIDEHFVQFITGSIDLNDETWNAYVSLVESIGVEELTEVYQAAYDRYYGK